MTYRTIHTRTGLQAMAAAEAAGTPIQLTHMAVGDGNGNPVTPTEGQTNLAREMYRAPINRVFQDAADNTKFTTELVIPASVGGFTLREIGVFTAAGSLFAVGNVPDTYKPQASEGAFSDTIVRLEFRVTNATVIAVAVDPNVATASQAWVLTNINACHVIPGGTTGQVLRKASNGCGDTEWGNPTDTNVVVTTREERKTLAAAQTVVTLAVTTTEGLAVYIEGVRLPRVAGAEGWQPDAITPDTKIVLGQSYPAGTRIIAVQNEPLGGVEFPLARAQNLADVPDKSQARNNLDVFSRAESRTLAPAGQVSYFASSTAPTGWLKANGAAISRTAYADLFAAIGVTFGAGDGFNTFNLPDLRGEFLRGWDDARGVDAGRVLGSTQAGQNLAHSHGGATGVAGEHTHVQTAVQGGFSGIGPHIQGGTAGGAGSPAGQSTQAAGNHQHSIASDGGTETRPRNVALLACIKF